MASEALLFAALLLVLAARPAAAQTVTATPSPSPSRTPSASQSPYFVPPAGAALCGANAIFGSSSDVSTCAAGRSGVTVWSDTNIATHCHKWQASHRANH
jgi:hypothetical protein